MRPAQRRKIVREHEPLQDGQKTLEVRIIRRTKTKPVEIEISAPKALTPIQGAFGKASEPIVETRKYVEKQIGVEIERFRWMRPDGKGGLVPR